MLCPLPAVLLVPAFLASPTGTPGFKWDVDTLILCLRPSPTSQLNFFQDKEKEILSSLLMTVAEIRVDVICTSFEKIHFAEKLRANGPHSWLCNQWDPGNMQVAGKGLLGTIPIPGGALLHQSPAGSRGLPPSPSHTQRAVKRTSEDPRCRPVSSPGSPQHWCDPRPVRIPCPAKPM